MSTQFDGFKTFPDVGVCTQVTEQGVDRVVELADALFSELGGFILVE